MKNPSNKYFLYFLIVLKPFRTINGLCKKKAILIYQSKKNKNIFICWNKKVVKMSNKG